MIYILLIAAYIFIGFLVGSAFKEDWQKPSVLVMLTWPVMIATLLYFGLLAWIIIIGKEIYHKIKEKIGGRNGD